MKKIFTIILATILVATCASVMAFASDDIDVIVDSDTVVNGNVAADVVPDVADEIVIEPFINTSVKVNLDTKNWSAITGDNNVLAVTVKVTSDTNNPGKASIKILDGDGQKIGSETSIDAGKSASWSVPFDAGHYSIQGKAVSVAGYYTFSVKD